MGVFSFQINKNMTSGEGGCVVTNDSRLYKRAFACHDTGYVRDEKGREVFNELDLCLWGRSCRLDELRGAILRVQLTKLPRILAKMRSSKYRIRQALQDFPQIKLRRIVDTDGDTGCFLISTYPDAETARKVSHALHAEGIVTWPQGVSNVVVTDWGLHIYYNLVSVVHCTSSDKRGFPWNSKRTNNRRRRITGEHARWRTAFLNEAFCWPSPHAYPNKTRMTSSTRLRRLSAFLSKDLLRRQARSIQEDPFLRREAP
jgi:DegT/DnrJ/EryC1/StrS aminotransferase family